MEDVEENSCQDKQCKNSTDKGPETPTADQVRVLVHPAHDRSAPGNEECQDKSSSSQQVQRCYGAVETATVVTALFPNEPCDEAQAKKHIPQEIVRVEMTRHPQRVVEYKVVGYDSVQNCPKSADNPEHHAGKEERGC